MTALDIERERQACEAWHGGIYRGLQAEIAQAAWLAAKRASQPVPRGGDMLLAELDWCITEGQAGPRTKSALESARRAIAAHISGQGGEGRRQ
jgi:hypothetical protein